jgi:hypothetical protein
MPQIPACWHISYLLTSNEFPKMTINRIFTVIAALLISMPKIFAQFNDSTNYYTNYTGTGIINKTNDGNSYLLNNSLRFNIYKKNYSLNTTNTWIFGEQKSARSNNDFSSVVDLNLFKSERHIYYWALASYDKSLSLKINHRWQAGAGIGYYAIDRETFVLQLSDGLLFDKGDLYDTESSNNDYSIVRNSFRIKFRIVAGDKLVLENSDFLQHSLKDPKDYIIKSTTNLSIKLKKWLSFTTALTYNQLSVTKRENLVCSFGITLENYF